MAIANSENGIVRIGIEVGEHISDFENYLGYIKHNYDLSKIDFVLITMKPIPIRESLWYEWAEFFSSNRIYFAFLYTQQRGAPEGKISHLEKNIVTKIKDIAGDYFIGDMIGETGGLASWMEGYYEDCKIEKCSFDNLIEAKDNYIEHVSSRVEIDRKLGLPAVLAVEATIFNRYNFEAGVDYAFVEMMCGNPEVMFASARGASKAYGKVWWASHIANEWYGGLRNDDPLKYKRLKLAYYYSFMAGAKFIYPESGDIKIASYGSNYGANSEFCKEYRSVWKEFSDFVHLHKRPAGGPKTKIAFLQGNLDSWTGWGGATVWNRFGDEAWIYGAPERSWNVLSGIFQGESWHNPAVFGETDNSFSVPYGQYDIVPVEASPEVLGQYSCLIFAGWNTMTSSTYEKLKAYVYKGGTLVISVPHLNTCNKRGDEYALINNGDCSELFGCTIKGAGEKLNWGVKFINESMIPGCLYPYVKNGECDPICASGAVRCADIRVTGGKVAAILSDRFNKWREDSPALLVENVYGKGRTALITSWDYPGADGMQSFFKVLLKSILAGECRKSDLKVVCSDKVHFAAYSGENNSYTVYLLNTDYNCSSSAKVIYGDNVKEVEIGSCDIQIVYITK